MEPPAGLVSYEDFLKLDAASNDVRYEYYDGLVVAMAQPSRAHEIIVSNLSLLLGPEVRKRGCEFVTAGAVWSEARNTEVNPDWLVLCDARDLDGAGPERTRSRSRFPSMVVEVLSPDDRAPEMLDKLETYMSIESVKLYLVIDSTRQKIRRYIPAVEGHLEVPVTGDAVETPFGIISQTAIYERSGVPVLRKVSLLIPGA